MATKLVRILATCLIAAGVMVGAVPISAARDSEAPDSRTESATYVTTGYDSGQGSVTLVCAPDFGSSCVEFAIQPTDRFVTLKIEDANGVIVAGSITQAGNDELTGLKFCGKTESPVPILPEGDIDVSLISGGCGSPTPSLTGTVSATFTSATASGTDEGELESPQARLDLSNHRPRRGSTVTAIGSLGVCDGHVGTTIELQRKTNGSFATVDEAPLDDDCRATFRLVANFREAVFRSLWDQQDDDHAMDESELQKIKTRN